MRELLNMAVEGAKDNSGNVAILLPWLFLFLGLTVVEAVSHLFNRFLMQRFADDAELSITTKILDHAARLDVAFFEDPRFQDIIHRARQNTANHFSRFMSDILLFITRFVQTATLISILAFIEPIAIVVLIPLTLPHFHFRWRLSKRHYLEEHRRATKRRWSSYFISLLTARQSVQEVKLLGLAPIFIKRFRSIMTEFRHQKRKRYITGFSGDSVFAVLTTVAFFAMFTRVFHRFFQGSLLIGDVVVFGTVGLRLRGALETVVASISRAMENALYVSNLREFLKVQPGIEPTRGQKPSSTRGEIKLCNVSFTYPGTDALALSNISLCLTPGETVALVGENGAGKTTLVKLIARFYDPNVGSVFYDGIDLRELSLDYLYRQIAFVPQSFGRYEATASENIAYGDWNRLQQDRAQIERIAHYAGVNKMIEKMPQGYDTIIGRMFGEYDLSGGEWQQIALARAFARDATLLILDEPTSNLDAKAEYELFNRYRELSKGKTTILISHRFSTVSMADRILVMDKGRIVEAGTHSELITNKGHYATLYELHQRQKI